MADDKTDTDDDASGERRQKRRQRWIKALRDSFHEDVPRSMEPSLRSGAELDADIAALEQRVSALETNDAKQDQRLTALEAGTPVTPPVEPPIDPVDPPVTPPSGKRYPVADDPMCGVPAGTQLTASGSVSSNKDGQVIQNLNITGNVRVTHKNVTLKNCRITSGDWTIVQGRVAGFTVDHCDVIGKNTVGSSGIDGYGTFTYNKIRAVENGINIAGDNATLEWNDIDKMGGVNGQSHYDCIQADGSFKNMTVKHNRLNCDKGDTSGCMIDNYWGPVDNVLVEDNFIGGGSFPAYCSGGFGGSAGGTGGPVTNVKYLNNDMRPGGWNGYFYWQNVGSGCVKQGNKDAVSGKNVDNL